MRRSDEPPVWRVFQRRGTISLLNNLRAGPLRSADAESSVPFVDKAIAYRRLKELRELGLVERHLEPGPPIEAWYELSEEGERLARAAEILESFGSPSEKNQQSAVA